MRYLLLAAVLVSYQSIIVGIIQYYQLLNFFRIMFN